MTENRHQSGPWNTNNDIWKLLWSKITLTVLAWSMSADNRQEAPGLRDGFSQLERCPGFVSRKPPGKFVPKFQENDLKPVRNWGARPHCHLKRVWAPSWAVSTQTGGRDSLLSRCPPQPTWFGRNTGCPKIPHFQNHHPTSWHLREIRFKTSWVWFR